MLMREPLSRAAEVQRLARLERLDILDTLPEAFCNSVAAAAACLANTPMSAVTFIDADRQWYKSSCGMGDGQGQVPRSESVCAASLLGGEPAVIIDLSVHPYFRHNPYVAGPPYARFYAGFPIMVDGHAVGALCVIDDRPRMLTPSQLDELQALTADVADWLKEREGR